MTKFFAKSWSVPIVIAGETISFGKIWIKIKNILPLFYTRFFKWLKHERLNILLDCPFKKF